MGFIAAKPGLTRAAFTPLCLVSLTIGDMAESEDELMAKAAGGSQAACGKLADRYLPRTVNLARRILGNTAEAEDVAQEVFLRLWKTAPQWRPGGARLTTWLHRVTVNLCIDRQRDKSRQFSALDAIAEPVDPAPLAEAGIITRQTAARVQQALLMLPARQRIAIVLCHYERHSNAEAADILGLNLAAMESLLSRGRRTMLRLLSGERRELLDDV